MDAKVVTNLTADAALESLESRRLMSASLADGILTVGGLADSNNTIAVGFKGGEVHAVVNGQRTSFSLAGLKAIKITGGEAADVVNVDPSVTVPVRVRTLGGDDRVIGGSAGDVIETGAGNDTVYGMAGDDAINAGAGDDRVYGGAGDDAINGGSGADKLFGEAGRDLFLKVERGDKIYGGSGLDAMTAASEDAVSSTPAVGNTPATSSTGNGKSGQKAAAATATVSLSLVDADTGKIVSGYEAMTDGMTLDLSKLPAHLSVRANLSGGSSSVRFDVDSKTNFRTENAAPYALGGDMSGKFKAVTFTAGTHTITANAMKNGGVLASDAVTFTVTNPAATSTKTGGKTTTGGTTASGGSTPTTDGTTTTGSGGTSSGSSTGTTAATPVAAIRAISRIVPAGTSVHVDALTSQLKGGNWNDGYYAWDFGDAGTEENQMRGFNAAHTYDTPGSYVVTLTVTNAAGITNTTTMSVTVTAAARKVIYVAANGSDTYDGSSPNRPIKTIAKAESLIDDNTEFRFRRGDTFAMTEGFNIRNDNVVFAAYGSGAKPTILWTGTRDNQVMFTVNKGTTDFTAQDLTIDTIFNQDTTDAGTPLAFQPGGVNFTARRLELRNLMYGFNLNLNPSGVMIQDNTAPLVTGLRKYFAWVQGDHVTIAGNYAANSTREHIVRANFASMLNVSDNEFHNISRRDLGDYWDYRKTALNIQSGEFAYLYHNKLDGSFQVGPLGQTEGDKGMMTASMRFKYAVGEANEVINDEVVINHGAEHVTLRDNVIRSDGLLAINVDGYNEQYQREVVDLTIESNTAINNAASGSFLRVYGPVGGIKLLDNVYVAPNLAIGEQETAVIKMEADAYSSFTQIDGNVWPTAASTAPWIHEQGINYIGTGYTADGFKTAAEWNALSAVGDDTFQTVTEQQADTLVIGGVAVGARNAA